MSPTPKPRMELYPETRDIEMVQKVGKAIGARMRRFGKLKLFNVTQTLLYCLYEIAIREKIWTDANPIKVKESK